jgi:hypothetical protein
MPKKIGLARGVYASAKDLGTRAESIAKRIHLSDHDQTWKSNVATP